jgi:hypothetical protein
MRKRAIMNSRNIRDDYFLALRKAWQEWPKPRDTMENVQNHSRNVEDFYQWCRDIWGFEVVHESGGISENYNIVNDSKFMLFKLKYYTNV